MELREIFPASLLVGLALTMGCDFGSAPAPSTPPDKPVIVIPDAGSSMPDNRASGLAASDFDDKLDGSATVVAQPSRNPLRDVSDPFYMAGRKAPEWELTEWANSRPLLLDQLRGQVVVVRFWNDDSPDCEKSMTALAQLANSFRGQPVKFVGIYHSSTTLPETKWETAVAQARQWEVSFPIAYDRRQRTLNDWWRRHVDHMPPFPTFVIGADGRIAHLHPGPVYFPTDDPLDKLCNEDFLALRGAIQQALSHHLAHSHDDAIGP